MSFIQRLFGRQRNQADGESRLRRASHVTPSRAHTSPAPPEDEPPQQPRQDEPPAEQAAASVVEHADSPDETPQHAAPAEVKPQEFPPAKSEPPSEARPAPPILPEPPPDEPKLIPRPEPSFKRQRQALAYGIASHVGRLRENNEDACFGMQWHSITVDERPDFGFFIVADGMGGHLHGERAAGIALQTLAADMLARVYSSMLRDFQASDSPTILDSLVSAAESANHAVMQQVPGGGTTLTAVAIVGNLAYLAHVGDSRAYLIHDGLIEQLTTDHTLVQRLIQMKELTLEQAEHYPQKNVLYRAIGQSESLAIERLIRALPPGARIVICTDGLWDLVNDDAIREVAQSAATPQDACDKLVELANARGGIDNITVIAVKLPDATA